MKRTEDIGDAQIPMNDLSTGKHGYARKSDIQPNGQGVKIDGKAIITGFPVKEVQDIKVWKAADGETFAHYNGQDRKLRVT